MHAPQVFRRPGCLHTFCGMWRLAQTCATRSGTLATIRRQKYCTTSEIAVYSAGRCTAFVTCEAEAVCPWVQGDKPNSESSRQIKFQQLGRVQIEALPAKREVQMRARNPAGSSAPAE